MDNNFWINPNYDYNTKYSIMKQSNHSIDDGNESSNKSNKRSWCRVMQCMKVPIPAHRRRSSSLYSIN